MVIAALRNLFLALILLASPALSFAAKPVYLKLSVESNEVYAGDVIVLEIEHTGLTDPLETGILDSIGFVRRETAGTRIAVLAGKVIDIRIRRIEIALKEPGVVVIGPLSAGDIQSNSVSVKVLKDVPSNWQPGPDDVQAAMRVSQPNPYVQQQIVLDLELRHRFPLASETFELPDLSGFRVMKRFAARRPASLTGDWRIIRWRYLLFAEQSGDQTISPFAATGSIIKSRRDRGEFSVRTEPIELTIQPAQSGGWWLPAQQVSISESWSKDKRELAAGDETIRSITVTAQGVSAAQIPDVVMPPARGLKVTAIGVDRQTNITDEGASGIATFDFRVLAMSPIPVFPDTIRIEWFDVNEKRERQAILPAQRIQIGMPDREALLEAVGEQRSRTDQLIEQVQSTNYRRWLLPIAAVLFALSLLLLLTRVNWRARAARTALQKRSGLVWSQISSNDYRSAIRKLRETPRDVGLTDTGKRVLEDCERQVFGTPNPTPIKPGTDPLFYRDQTEQENQLLARL